MSADHVNSGAPTPDGSAPRKKKKKKRSIFRMILSIFSKLLLTVFTLCVIAVLTIAIFAQYFLSYINTVLAPTVTEIEVEDMTMSLASTIYCKDENGEWIPLRVIYEVGGNRELVEYKDLPDHLIKAVVAIEDKRFWTHKGVDWISTATSIKDTLLGDSTRGGSTITQQMLRNLSNREEDKEVTVLRKFREILRALEFEKSNSKEDILTLYLNKVNFGHAEGIGMAAKVYFGKDVSELDLAESAAIIAITNNPSLYDPFFDIEYVQDDGSVKTPRDFNKKRQTDILWTMWQQGIIDEATYIAARDEFLLFTDTDEYKALHADDPEEIEDSEGGKEEAIPTGTDNGVVALHRGTYTWFEDAVVEDAIALIMEQQGVSKSIATDKLYGGGYHIYTTLDLRIQEIVDGVYEDPSNFDYPSDSGQPLASAITVVDPYTGDVLAMSGGVGVKEGNRLLNLSRAPRQVGSAIKPVSVYAPAIDAGIIGPVSVADDYPLRINEAHTNGYPRDDSGYYTGYQTISYGIQASLNCVAAQTLTKLGLPNSFEFMENNLGFDLVLSDLDIGPLSMGGLTDGLTTEEMAAAFSAFPNEGIYNKPRTIICIESNDHTQLIVDNPVESTVAMKKSTAYLMNQMLQNVVNGSPGSTGNGARFDGMTIAGKTGTTNSRYTRYFCGYTPYYAAAVWTGYKDKDEPIKSNHNPAAKIWRLVMEKVHEGLENKSFFEKPDGIMSVSVCADCGMLSTDLCAQDYRGSRVVTGEMPEDALPSKYCTCHVEVRLCRDAVTGSYFLAGDYCPDDHIVTRVMVSGREFLKLTEDVVNEDGTITPGAFIHAEDEQAHLTYWQMVGVCPIHTENSVPGGPGEGNQPGEPGEPEEPGEPGEPGEDGEPVPGDPGYVPPDWMWDDDPDDPTDGETTPGEPGTPEGPDDSREPETPGEPEIPQEPPEP